jgi:DNA-binding transcriptional MocR family regulator
MSMILTTQGNVSDKFINLGYGLPGFSLLPLEIMREAAAHRLGQGDVSLLQYGTNQGDGYFRLALADFLTAQYGQPVAAEELFVTAGNSQALDLLCTLFTQPNDVIFVEEPSYFLALRIFSDHRLKVVSIPTDENGLMIEALEEKLAEQQPAFVYTIPTFHNPTGITLPASRRERLAELSQQHNVLIVADEVYHLLNYTTTPPPPMASYAEQGNILSLGSFSKIIAPGLRLGWIQAPYTKLKPLISRAVVDSGGSLNHFTSGLVRSVLELGLQDQHLAQLKRTYQQRLEALDSALREHLPNTITYRKPEGGFFFWLRLPEEMDAKTLLAEAKKHDVGFKIGTNFSSQQGLHNYIRLSFSFYEIDKLLEGVKRLKKVLG